MFFFCVEKTTTIKLFSSLVDWNEYNVKINQILTACDIKECAFRVGIFFSILHPIRWWWYSSWMRLVFISLRIYQLYQFHVCCVGFLAGFFLITYLTLFFLHLKSFILNTILPIFGMRAFKYYFFLLT